MKQFLKIFSFEFKSYLKNKVFVGVTVFLVVLTAVVLFFPRVTSLRKPADTIEASPSYVPTMLVKADDLEQGENITEVFALAFSGYQVETTSDAVESIKSRIVAGEIECAFVMTGQTSYTYYVNNLSMYDSNTVIADEVLQQLHLVNAMVEGGMTPEQAGAAIAVPIGGRIESLGTDQFQNFFYTYIMIFALYMVILLYGQMVATNVATEKSSRAMEVLITSAKPASMMFGKVLASCCAGLLQIVAVFGSSLLFFDVNRAYWGESAIVSSIFDMPPLLFVYMLVFFVLGFLVYAFMYGAIGSTASKLEDINTSVMPITLLFIVGFFVVVYSMTSSNMDNALLKICSFVPFTSPMAMFTRVCMSVVPWHEIAISIALLAGSVVGIGMVSAKIYRVGVLLYGNPPKLGALLKSIWKA